MCGRAEQPTPVQTVHRDLKTCNVMLSDPKDRVPKLINLGLAKEQGISTGQTTTGVGTTVRHPNRETLLLKFY